MKITMAGSGYVGLVTGACLASTGNRVVGYDINALRVQELNEGACPIFEPGLAELLKAGRESGRLRFTTDIKEATAHAEVVFIAIGTPPRADGSADLSGIEAFARDMSPLITRPLVVAIKSTVPVGTAEKVEAILRAGARHEVHVASNPEFLKEGGAVRDFQFPDRVVIGTESAEAGETVRELYLPFVRNQRPILILGRRAAELTKYAANAFLATRVSFINEIANLCERLGVDVDEVRRGMGTDQRIGQHFLYPGAGYGGSCFPKDVRALAHVAREAGVEPRVLSAVHEVNERQKRVLFEKIRRRFGETRLRGLKVAVWGVAFKANTDDIREAPSLVLMDALLAAGSRLRAHDPEAMENLKEQYGDRIEYFTDAYEALKGADALAICTEWNEFRSPDFKEMASLLKERAIFDGRNLYEPATVRRHGLEYHPIGRADRK